MRRLIVHRALPLVCCAIPLLAGLLIALAIPSVAMQFYLKHLSSAPMDWIILVLGTVLFLAQTALSWRALQWREGGFDDRPDRWLSHLAQGAEWFPLLGLLGTVGGILQTFSQMRGASVTPAEIIQNYAPAITATGSGLFMALLNILPIWLVTAGRDVIASLSGEAPISDRGMP